MKVRVSDLNWVAVKELKIEVPEWADIVNHRVSPI